MILKKIIERTEERVKEERRSLLLPKREKGIVDFRASLERGAFSIIAEFKPSSPSGVRARWKLEEYIPRVSPCASAISVLTEPYWFKGSYLNLKKISLLTDRPLLFKDFVIDEIQVEAAYSFGADAVLLMYDVLGEDELRYLAKLVKAKGLQTLVEVSSPEDALSFDGAAYVDVLGINSRDFKTLKVDINRIARGGRVIEKSFPLAESGLKTSRDAFKVGAWGFRGALVGTSLMESPDPRTKCLHLKASGTEGLFWLP
ncbi:indole-3-glycerol phosphate synthase [Ignicoccus pacificus DSM 13166]|uniref:indole-3-glycerol-phosphate synthase n=1 Tax=Ignicoccus pacificus DSM 13166 TaxID=940294 RepID=A0A977PK56_9CREN|nr:indole-3-glycerol phosphate synthase [Ignicoccus pacificus DSM 13166]